MTIVNWFRRQNLPREASRLSHNLSESGYNRLMPISVARSPLELIGHTPVVRLNRIPGKDDAEVWAKLENYNPGGSVKDRICLAMIERAEREGHIKPGDTIVEPTSGNTGIGLALVCAVKGYKLTLTMPDTMSEERRSLLAAYGATLVLTPDTRGMHGAIAKAEELVRANPGYFMPQQFSNPANPEVHYQTTGPELIEQLGSIDAFIAGVGTGGTISGTGRYLREKLQNRPLIVAVEPKNSPVLEGGEAGFHKIQGIGAGFIPSNLDTTIYDEVIAVSDDDATIFSRRIAREEGLLVGISSGANCCAALQIAKRLGKGKVVVVVFCDTGERYLTTDLFQADGI
jgi:cysteine synthase A